MVVVLPSDAELNDPLGLDHALQQGDLLILGVSVDDGLQRGEDLLHGLQEFGLIGVLGAGFVQDLLNVLVHSGIPPIKYVSGYAVLTEILHFWETKGPGLL